MPARGTVTRSSCRCRCEHGRGRHALRALSGSVADWMGNGVVIPVRRAWLRSERAHPTRRTTSPPVREVAARPIAVREVGVRRVAAAAARDAIRGCGADGRHHGAWGTKVFLSRAVRPWMLRLHAHRAGNHGHTRRPHFRPCGPSGMATGTPYRLRAENLGRGAGMGVETRVDSWPRTTGFGFASWRSWSVSRPWRRARARRQPLHPRRRHPRQ